MGDEWVKARFEPHLPAGERTVTEGVFVPSRLEDNPHLDRADHERSLAELDPVTQAQPWSGDWNVMPSLGFLRDLG